MDIFITDDLINILTISVTFSIVLMAFIQKLKDLEFINKSWQVWILNLVFAFIIGIPFSIFFYKLEVQKAIWVGVFGFIGAPTLYDALKSQNLINYTPKSSSENTDAKQTESTEIERT